MTLRPLTPSIADPAAPRYAPAAELGRGGMGVVLRVDDRDLGRPVALKVNLDVDADAAFLREARVTAQLEHPNIIPVHDVGAIADGRLFFTMKVVGGRTFSAILREQGPLRPLLEILLRTGDAVAFAHSRGVVHRDLKPANIMVGAFGEVLVMDWGLARVENLADVRGGAEPAELGDSLDGAVVGTPSYMPPEQARGEPVDARADVYALGAILYEILLGVPPVTGSTVHEVLQRAASGSVTAPDEYLHALQRRDPARCARLRGRGVPPELAAIAMKALAREPHRRYATADELQQDLRNYLAGRPVTARRDPIAVRAAKWVRRNPVPAAAVAAAIAALLGGVFVVRAQAAADRRAEFARLMAAPPTRERCWAALALEPESAEARARLEEIAVAEQRAEEQKRRQLADERSRDARGIRNALPDDRREVMLALARAEILLSEAHDLGGDVAGDREEVNEALGRMALDGGDFLLARLAFSTCAGAERLVGLVDEAEQKQLRDRADRIAGAINEIARGLARNDRERGAPLVPDYIFEVVRYRDEQTVRLLAESLEPLRARATPDTLWTQEDRDLMAFAFGVLGRLGLDSAVAPLAGMMEALWDYESAAQCGLALCRTRRPEAYEPLATASRRLGINSGAWSRIEPLFKHVPRPATLEEPTTSMEYLWRAGERAGRGDLDGAIADLNRAIELDPLNEAAWSDRGLARKRAGDLAGAITDYTRALEILPSSVAYNNRGSAREAMGDLDGAMSDYTESIARDPRNAIAYSNRGLARMRRDDLAGAVADFAKAIEIDPRRAEFYNNRAGARRRAGDADGAIADYTRAIEMDPRHATAFNNRAVLHRQKGDFEAALEDYGHAIALDPGDARLYNNRGLVRKEQGRLDAAIEDYTRAIDLDPSYAKAWQNRGLARKLAGDLDGAAADLEKFLELAPEHPDAGKVREIVRELRGGF